MKICKECNEPKFNWQMKKISWTRKEFMGGFLTERMQYCKKCIKKDIFEYLMSLHTKSNEN